MVSEPLALETSTTASNYERTERSRVKAEWDGARTEWDRVLSGPTESKGLISQEGDYLVLQER